LYLGPASLLLGIIGTPLIEDVSMSMSAKPPPFSKSIRIDQHSQYGLHYN